ncbi:MAG: hypothetical protein N3D10_04165, partial [Candidatus Micrarchaeota archaeon]|nr:hypothetical protein [Candidatus Micrarchaeota archaeon]
QYCQPINGTCICDYGRLIINYPEVVKIGQKYEIQLTAPAKAADGSDTAYIRSGTILKTVNLAPGQTTTATFSCIAPGPHTITISWRNLNEQRIIRCER